MATLHASRFTLHASRFTLHASRFIKGFRSAALIGVASLSLAACGGGGDSTVTAPAPLTPLPPDNRDPDPDCTAVPRPAGCPDREPVVPMPLAGLGDVFKTGAAIAIKEVADTHKVQASGPNGTSHPRVAKLGIHGLQPRMPKNSLNVAVGEVLRLGRSPDLIDTKLANVAASKKGSNIVYSFGLYTPGSRNPTAFATGLAQIASNPFGHKIFSLENNDAFTSVKTIESIATIHFGEDWDYSILQASVPSVKGGAKDSTLYAELWTDVASAGENDYMVGGWWLLAPNNPASDYRFGVFSQGEKYYPRADPGPVKPAVTGKATYKGPAAGLHTSSGNGMVSIQRLLGKVTLNADFGNATARGSIGGKIEKLTLDGESATGEILLPSATFGTTWPIRSIVATDGSLNPKSNLGNIKGINYKGDWTGTFQGDSSGTDQPTGIVGVVGGSGGGNSFVASFGAKKEKAE